MKKLVGFLSFFLLVVFTTVLANVPKEPLKSKPTYSSVGDVTVVDAQSNYTDVYVMTESPPVYTSSILYYNNYRRHWQTSFKTKVIYRDTGQTINTPNTNERALLNAYNVAYTYPISCLRC